MENRKKLCGWSIGETGEGGVESRKSGEVEGPLFHTGLCRSCQEKMKSQAQIFGQLKDMTGFIFKTITQVELQKWRETAGRQDKRLLLIV